MYMHILDLLQEKERDIQNLQMQVEVASKNSVEEVCVYGYLGMGRCMAETLTMFTW